MTVCFDFLNHVYGISFPDTKQMTEYKKFLEEAAKRDHRRIGKVRLRVPIKSSIR